MNLFQTLFRSYLGKLPQLFLLIFETNPYSFSLLTCSCPFGLGGLNCGNRKYAEVPSSAWAGLARLLAHRVSVPSSCPQFTSAVFPAPVLGGKQSALQGREVCRGDKHFPK